MQTLKFVGTILTSLVAIIAVIEKMNDAHTKWETTKK